MCSLLTRKTKDQAVSHRIDEKEVDKHEEIR